MNFVKITGQYDRKSGDLKIAVVPGNLYWIVLAFCSVAAIILAYQGITEDKSILIGSLLFLFVTLVVTAAFLLESRSFIKHLQGMLKLSDQSKI